MDDSIYQKAIEKHHLASLYKSSIYYREAAVYYEMVDQHETAKLCISLAEHLDEMEKKNGQNSVC